MVVKRTLLPATEYAIIDQNSEYLKAHLRDGSVYIFSSWQIELNHNLVTGQGNHYDVNRLRQQTGTIAVELDSVVLYETNRLEPAPVIRPLTVVTIASAALSTICLIPKACFGSCPTFYLVGEDGATPNAEGFSASVAPSLEASDIDALGSIEYEDKPIELRLTNEALETHVIRSADLLVFPRDTRERVYATSDGEFWLAASILEPDMCAGPEGDCLELIKSLDGDERYSVADPIDLATREIVELQFENVPAGDIGLVIASRQTLLTTFLFYQALAYMGDYAGAAIAQLERSEMRLNHPLGEMGAVLGGIEVMLMNPAGEWQTVGIDEETGPIATDTRLIKIPATQEGSVSIRLRMAKGNWRLDQIALALLDRQVKPIRLSPTDVYDKDGSNKAALAALTVPAAVLTTMPGDEYKIVYERPSVAGHYELFLESQGYYLEWMRAEWLGEKDLRKLNKVLHHPHEALRTLAPEFKKIEDRMEATFWSSRYAKD